MRSSNASTHVKTINSITRVSFFERFLQEYSIYNLAFLRDISNVTSQREQSVPNGKVHRWTFKIVGVGIDKRKSAKNQPFHTWNIYIYIHVSLRFISSKIIDIASIPIFTFSSQLVRPHKWTKNRGKRSAGNFEEYRVGRYTPFNLPRESPEKSWLFFKPNARDPTRLEKRAARMLRPQKNSERTATINARHSTIF